MNENIRKRKELSRNEYRKEERRTANVTEYGKNDIKRNKNSSEFDKHRKT